MRISKRLLVLRLLIVLLAGWLPVPAMAGETDLTGLWHKNGSKTSALKLILRQDGNLVTGHFSNGVKKWAVAGKLTESGELNMVRSVPVAELRNSSKNQIAAFQKKFRNPKNPTLLPAPVKFTYKKANRSLKGHYTRPARKEDGTLYLAREEVQFAQNSKKHFYLTAKNTRFHRLFIAGPGRRATFRPLKGQVEQVAFAKQAVDFKTLLKKLSPSIEGGTSLFIQPATRKMTVKTVLQFVSDMAKKVRTEDQVLVYFTGHGSGGGYDKYKFGDDYRKALTAHLNGKMTRDELEIIKFYKPNLFPSKKKMAELRKDYFPALYKMQILEREFEASYFNDKSSEDRALKDFKSKEKYNEWIFLTDLNQNYDTDQGDWIDDVRFAHGLKPLVATGAMVTVIMDSCFGGGFKDNLSGSSNVRVIGLRTLCNSPLEFWKPNVTSELEKLIEQRSGWPGGRSVSALSAATRLNQLFPGLVGNPHDDERDK